MSCQVMKMEDKVYVLVCGETLSAAGVYATLEEAIVVCDDTSTVAFVDEFILGQRRRDPGSFNNVHQNIFD
jgi:hypothetical protein